MTHRTKVMPEIHNLKTAAALRKLADRIEQSTETHALAVRCFGGEARFARAPGIRVPLGFERLNYALLIGDEHFLATHFVTQKPPEGPQ